MKNINSDKIFLGCRLWSKQTSNFFNYCGEKSGPGVLLGCERTRSNLCSALAVSSYTRAKL